MCVFGEQAHRHVGASGPRLLASHLCIRSEIGGFDGVSRPSLSPQELRQGDGSSFLTDLGRLQCTVIYFYGVGDPETGTIGIRGSVRESCSDFPIKVPILRVRVDFSLN